MDYPQPTIILPDSGKKLKYLGVTHKLTEHHNSGEYDVFEFEFDPARLSRCRPGCCSRLFSNGNRVAYEHPPVVPQRHPVLSWVAVLLLTLWFCSPISFCSDNNLFAKSE